MFTYCFKFVILVKFPLEKHPLMINLEKLYWIFFCSHIKNFIIYEIYYLSAYKIHNFLFIQISCYTDNKEIISIMIQLDMPFFMLQAFVFITFSKKINCAIQIEEIWSAKTHKLLDQLGSHRVWSMFSGLKQLF